MKNKTTFTAYIKRLWRRVFPLATLPHDRRRLEALLRAHGMSRGQATRFTRRYFFEVQHDDNS